jgi:alanine dehydrogenase
MLDLMRPGSVFVDIAVDQGGCAMTTRPTTHADPTFVEHEVVHYCVANMPGAYPRTSSQALNNVTHRWILLLADLGLAAAIARRPELAGAVNCHHGTLTCPPVGEAHNLPVSSPPWHD